MLYHWDVFWFNVVNHGLDNRVFDVLMPAITQLGLGGWQAAVLAGLFLPARVAARRVLGQMFAALVLSGLLCQAIKSLVHRPRPPAILPHVDLLVHPLYTRSFPSGHTTTSFALALVLALHYPRWAVPALLAAAAVGLSRVYVGVHYPSDVLAGAMLGGLSGYAVWRGFRTNSRTGVESGGHRLPPLPRASHPCH